MPEVDILGYAYAAIVTYGGILGYQKAASIPSLGAGLVFGGALAYGAWEASHSNYVPQLTTTAILTGVMGYRFYNTGKIMPAGVVCLVSTAMLVKILANAAGYSLNKKV